MKWPSRPNQLLINTNAMNLVVNLTITPNLMFYLIPGYNQVKLVSFDNKVKLSYKSMQMWYTYELYVYDLSWVSRQHDVWIWHEGPALYLYMISAEFPSSMTLGSGARVIVEEKVLSRIKRGSFDHLEQCSRPQRRLLQKDNTWKWLVPSKN